MEPSRELFGDGRANVQSTIAMVEGALRNLGHAPQPDPSNRLPGLKAAWIARKGSATVRISVSQPAGTSAPILRVESQIVTSDPSRRAALAEYLLAVNYSLHGAAFAMRDGKVFVLAERTTLDLDPSEVIDIIRAVQDHADRYDDELVAQYGGELG